MSLPVSPDKATAKGWPLLEVLVAQQIPLSEDVVMLRLSRLMRCKSPNRRLACAASRRPPRSKASCVGQAGSARARSHAHRAASGKGKASLLSRGSSSTLKAAMSGRPKRSRREGISAILDSQDKALRACLGASLQDDLSCLRDSAQACGLQVIGQGRERKAANLEAGANAEIHKSEAQGQVCLQRAHGELANGSGHVLGCIGCRLDL